MNKVRKCYLCEENLCGDRLRAVLLNPTSSAMGFIICEKCFSQKEKLDKELRDFQNFADSLKIAYREFCLSKLLYDKIKTKLYNNVNYRKIWDTLLRALEENYKRWLANISEQPPSFLKFDSDNQVIVKEFFKLRMKYFGHYDKDFLRNATILALEYEEINNLFNKIIKLAEEYNQKKFNIPFEIKNIKEDISDNCDKWLENFKPHSFWKRFFIKID